MPNSPSFNIRKMMKEDIAAVVEIMLNTELWQRYAYKKEKLTKMFLSSLDTDDLMIVSEIGDEIAGFAWLQENAMFGKSAYLKLIGVDEKFRGLRVGRGMLDWLEQNQSELFLLVSDFNISAQEFYKKAAYSQVGEIPNYAKKGINELIFYKRIKN